MPIGLIETCKPVVDAVSKKKEQNSQITLPAKGAHCLPFPSTLQMLLNMVGLDEVLQKVEDTKVLHLAVQTKLN